jgi:hypothetical protein
MFLNFVIIYISLLEICFSLGVHKDIPVYNYFFQKIFIGKIIFTLFQLNLI